MCALFLNEDEPRTVAQILESTLTQLSSLSSLLEIKEVFFVQDRVQKNKRVEQVNQNQKCISLLLDSFIFKLETEIKMVYSSNNCDKVSNNEIKT